MINKHSTISLSIFIFCCFIILLFLYSCTTILTTMYGVKKQELHTTKEIQKIATSYGVNYNELYFLQKSYIDYFDSLGSIYGFNIRSCDTVQLVKNHFQPLQILFFDKRSQLVAFHNNCFCGGFPNLKWNRNYVLDTIPAKQVVPLDTLLTFHG